MKKYLYKRFFYFILIWLIFSFLSFFVEYKFFIKQRAILYIKENLKFVALKLIEGLDHPEEFQEKIKSLEKYSGIRTTVIRKDGKVIFDSSYSPELMEDHSNRPEFIEALKKGEGFSIRLSPTLNKNLLYFAMFDNKRGYVVRVSEDYIKIYNFLKSFFYSLLLVYLIFVFIGLSLSFIFLGIITKPLVMLEDYVLNLENKKAVFLSGKYKELRNIFEKLNYLNEKIGESSLELPIENYISQIMEVIDFPVVIFDKSGGIKLCNKSFKEIFSGTEKDKYFWETINNFEIIEFIEKAIQKKEKIKFEVQHKNKFYTGISAFLEKAENLLLILYDITNIKLSEESKKNLIVNISHELKTPLSIIKGYIETLEDELKNSEYVNFVEIIRKHTDRLIEILERMLTISEVESEKIEIEEINLEEILRNIYKLFEKKAEEKNLEFVLNFEKVPRIKGDKLKIEQAIINIVDNAFKFTEKGKIEINLKKVNNYIMIEVKDTGPGIPEEEKFKIFERFYTLDKGRSKKGIGIGLSIVRHIINQHNGKIEVESKLNEGSSFKIFLPV